MPWCLIVLLVCAILGLKRSSWFDFSLSRADVGLGDDMYEGIEGYLLTKWASFDHGILSYNMLGA